MPESVFKAAYMVCVGLSLLILVWAAPRGCGVQRVASAQAKKDPSVRPGTRRTTYVFIGGYGGK